jgi:DNA-directed RNA polymerase subunit RPC12/RpoP
VKTVADQISNYQCPSCTGPLHYDGKSGRLKCDYCGSSFSVQQIEALYKDKDEAAAQAAQAQSAQDSFSAEGEWTGSGTNWAKEPGLKLYNCPSCGAELVCDETTAATACPYCGNPAIVPGQLSDMLKPDYVIPFKLSKEDAISALKKYYGGKKLLPRAFSNQNHIEEIKGVYVPFWLIDGAADADMEFSGTRSTSITQGKFIVTTTDYYRIRRSGTVNFEKLPVDASSKMPDEHMDAIEPFDYSELKPFSNAYLPGFLAERYDMEPEKCYDRADERAGNTAAELVGQTVRGYSSVTPLGRQIRIRRGRVSYALMPVWMLSTRWNGQNYLFAMNGQTGKLIGDLPVSNGRAWGWFAGISGGVAAVMAAILYFL